MDNVVFLRPPGTGKTHRAIALGMKACQAGHRVAFATAAEWVARLGDAHTQGRLQAELTRLGRVPLLVIDEVGYIPFEAVPDAPTTTARSPKAKHRRKRCERSSAASATPYGLPWSPTSDARQR